MLLMCLEVPRKGFFCFSVRDWERVCRKRLSLSSFLKLSTSSQNAEFYIYRSHMEIGLSEVIKLIKRTHFMSPLKMINLFHDMMPNIFPKNVGLEVLRPAIFMINRTQLKPKNQVLYVRKT